MAKEKARYFTFLLYPESIPVDWIERLETLGVQIAVSPIHDKDETERKNLTEDEQKKIANGGKVYKKAHYHVIYVAKNPVTADSVRVKIKRLLGDQSIAKVQIVIQSMENMYLYLTHESKDAIAKKKYKYDKKDIKHINNFDIDRYISMDVKDKDDILNLICDLIDEKDLANMRELRRFVKMYGPEHGVPSMSIVNSVLRSHTGYIRLCFDAVYQERKHGKYVVDFETGEISDEIQ